ncbi:MULTISPECIES: phosphotransferase [unclassified Streptomyces]|uniref:phosphotransferase n=1 Tax=unclassified Streptomyces TaxID=2593676 RepID=UPI00403CEB89
MTDPDLPPPLRAWAENTLGPLGSLRRLPPGASPATVWLVVRRTDNARFHLKTAPSAAAFTRETFAYRHAVPALPHATAPRLMAASAQHLTLILSALPGLPLPQIRLTEAAHRNVHGRAGTLVAELHQAGRPTIAARREASGLLPRLADASARHADAAGDRLSAQDQKVVMMLADRLRVLDRLPVGFIHGGNLESSLRWSGPSRLALDGFERSRFAPVVLDFVHLAYGPWTDRPRVRTAFFDGYGRALDPHEQQALRWLTGLHAMRKLAEGHARADQAAVDTARAVLDRLTTEVNV